MGNNIKDKIIDGLNNNSIYEVEGIFYDSIFEFSYRINSLYRYWNINKFYLENHIEILKEIDPEKRSADPNYECLEEDKLFYSETARVDIKCFPEYLRCFLISSILNIFENYLLGISKDFDEDDKKVISDQQINGYTYSYISSMVKGCGLQQYLSKTCNSNTEPLIEDRNRFIHQLIRTLPDDIKAIISSILDEMLKIDDVTVDFTFQQISFLAKEIELAYLEYCR